MVRVTAPGRGGIIGNPSDMYGGTVVSCSIGERADATVSPSPRLILDVYGQWAEIADEADLEFDPKLHFLDVVRHEQHRPPGTRFLAPSPPHARAE